MIKIYLYDVPVQYCLVIRPSGQEKERTWQRVENRLGDIVLSTKKSCSYGDVTY